jgi:hypothetical protein
MDIAIFGASGHIAKAAVNVLDNGDTRFFLFSR